MNNLLSKVKNFIHSYQLLTFHNTIIVGVSGGADSVTLLYLLKALQYEYALDLHVAHFNHNLRRSALREQKFVEHLAQKLNLKYSTAIWNISKKIEKGSIEELAREARFQFFMRVSTQTHADAIALAHTQDDLAETILMRILRGSGLQGTRGILPKKSIHGFNFIRPLLNVNRREIELYLKAERISFCTDPTNKSRTFFRNKIRLDLLPLLEKNYSKNIKSLLNGLSINSGFDYDYIEKAASEKYKKLKIKSKNKSLIKLHLPQLISQHPSLRRMIIRLAIEDLKGNTNQLTSQHIDSLEELLEHKSDGGIVYLPDGIHVYKDKTKFSLKKGK